MDKSVLKRNEIKYYITAPLHSCALLLVSGSIIQGFLLECGVSQDNVALYVSVLQVIQMLSMTVVAGAVEGMKSMIKVSALLELFQLPLLAVLAYFSFEGEKNVNLVFGAIFAVGAFAAVFQGVHGMLSYKLPYKIMDIKEYGRILGLSGVFVGLFSTLFSLVINYFTDSESFGYFGVMRIFFIVAAVLFLLSCVSGMSFRDIGDVSQSSRKHDKINIFKYKPFYILLMPNLLRGFHTGVWGVILLIGTSAGVVTSSAGAMMTVMLQAAAILGCFIYSRISSRINDGKLILLSSAAMALLMPLMLSGKNETVFFVIYFIANIVMNFINYGVPTAVTKIVDYRCIGQYSAWRMALHTLGTALGGIAVPPMTQAFGVYATLIIAGICQVISGVFYYTYMRKRKS